jgi:DNA polymerase III epsilon subunit-like protein
LHITLLSSPPPCTLDIEASGFGRHSYPIEVGYVLPNGRAVCMLVRPSAEWTHWDSSAQAVHGITRDSLLARGRSIRDVVATLNQDLAGLTVYCDGWAHDYAWLAALFEVADNSPRFKLESARRLLNETQLPLLDGAQKRLRAELKLDRHRASSDALVLQHALVALLQTPSS